MAANSVESRRRDRRTVAAEGDVAAEGGPVRSRPANENDPTAAGLMNRLYRRPPNTSYYAAFALSLAWIFGWFLIYSTTLFTGQPANLPNLMQAIAVLVVPILGIWILAYFLWRAQQMRHVSEVLLQSALRLIKPQDIAAEGITSIAQSVRNEVDLLLAGVEHAVQRAAALEDIVHKEISAIERAFGGNEERIRSLVTNLENQRTALHQASLLVGNEAAPLLSRLENNTINLDQVISNAQDILGRLESGLKGSTIELARTIDDVSARAAQAGDEIGSKTALMERMSATLVSELRTFSTHLQDQVTSLNGAATQLASETSTFGQNVQGMEGNVIAILRQSADALVNVNRDLTSTIERATGASASQIRQAAAEMTEILGATGDNISYHLKATSSEVAGLIETSGVATVQRIEESRNAISEGLQAISGDYLNRVTQSRQELESYLNQAAAYFSGNIDNATAKLAEQVDQAGSRLLTGLDQTTGQFLTQLDGTGVGIAGRMQDTAARLFKEITSNTDMITGQLDNVSTGIVTRLDQTAGTIAGHLRDTTGIVTRQMEESGLALAQNIENASGGVTERLINVSGDFVAQVGRAREDLFRLLGDVTGEMTGKLETATQDIFLRMDQASMAMSGQLDDTATRLYDHINLTAGDVTERVAQVTEKLTGQLDTSSGQLATLLDSTENRMGSQLEQATTELNALFRANTTMLTRQLDDSSTAVTNAFADTALAVTRQMQEVHTSMTDRLQNTSSSVATQLENAGNNMFARLDVTARDLGQRFDVATTMLERITGDISGRLAGSGAKFAEMLEGASSQMINDLGKASEAFSEGLGQTTMEISGRFEQETGLLVDRIDRAVQAFDSTANVTSTRLDEAHRKFAKHVETANTYLADQLQTSAAEMDERLEGVSMQLTGKLEMTGSRISSRLEDVAGLVEKSIDRFNDEMERALANRKDALDSLIGDANRRAEEVDKVMSNYMTMIEESLAHADTRAREISRLVAEQTQASLVNIEDEIKKLETASGGQINQASRVLREQHERAMAAMNEMLSATATDFQQTAQDMRITAQQVVKDIDGARAELKRAILDLPEETRSNADAMRRVVADQIAALNSLADVVKRQSGSLDFSGPGYLTGGRSGPGKSEGAPFSAPHHGTVSAQETATERLASDDDTPSPRRARSFADLARSSTPMATRRAEPAAAPARDIEQMTVKLHAAARDLVEAIDGTLPRDLEKRYGDGDRSVYTHRLFEGRGKKMQKLITSRYDEERLLRGRVDAYVRLFERLLDQLADVPRGTEMVEASLSSESGLIYMMLAESAGRIPPQ